MSVMNQGSNSYKDITHLCGVSTDEENVCTELLLCPFENSVDAIYTELVEHTRTSYHHEQLEHNDASLAL